MRRILSNNRGVALILVILMIAVIIALTLQLNLSSRSEVYEAANLRDGIKLLYIAKSGLYGGETFLIEDSNNFDSLNEDWANLELISAGSSAFFDEGHFMLNITDESGKIPINQLVKDGGYSSDIEDVLIRFLTLPEFNLDEHQAGDIIDAVKDWIDEDDEITGFGAENMYYEDLDPPHSCKNGPLDSVDELLMIKGITRALYYGTGETPGIREYLTVYGTGTININTAPGLVLMALSDEITGEMVSNMEEFRKDEQNNLSDPSWYNDVPGMDGITIPSALISVKSDTFNIISTGVLNNMSKRISSVVKRNSGKKTVQILSWKVD
ncbi:MAG: type II secretion system minor pseudopilin GspK [Deltaproteobacteria bacterium]|nr:type II secretion system minor pseudopilin GspK [Deltaproteobacteria bacterium]